MLNKIQNMNSPFRSFYFLLLVSIGLFLISNSIFNINLIQNNSDFVDRNNDIEESNLKNKSYYNQYYASLTHLRFSHKKNIQFNSYNNNNFLNNNKEIQLHRKFDINPMASLPKDLYLIKDIKIKKERFINSILPIIIDENQKILFDRSQLIRIQNSLNNNKTLNIEDQKFLKSIAEKYLVKNENRYKVDIINDLLKQVDIIPNSIVLAQAANESGWGSSRFARDFNALFGQYTYNTKNGIEPFYRESGEKYLIQFFPSINDSIESYFKNINTHFAYFDFRQTRKKLRDNNQLLDPSILSKNLNTYAKDTNYIHTILSIIKFNNLTQYDDMGFVTTKS